MAEPRRPRVIRSGPDGPAGSGTGGKAPADSPLAAPPASPELDPDAATGKVRVNAASKVSVMPLDAPAPTSKGTPASKGTAKNATPVPPESAQGTAATTAKWRKNLPGSRRASQASQKLQAETAAGAGKPAYGSGEGPAGPRGQESGATVLPFPEPAHRRRRRHVLIGISSVAAVLAIVMALAIFSPLLAVRTVTFEGRKLVPEATLQASVESLVGTPLPQITQDDLDALMVQIPQVKSSKIVVRPPSTLVVHLVERVPVALVKEGEEYLMVDQDGVQLGATTDPATVALPLIEGGKAVIGQDTFKAMTAVLATLPQSILGMLATASAKSPDAVELRLVDGKTVIWGNANDMELKASVLEALLLAPPPTQAPGKPAPGPVLVIDVSAPRHPVTR